MKVYMIRIGGIGMCGVAGILKGLGYGVYGSETGNLYPPSSEILEKLKVPIYKPDPANIKKIMPDVVIAGNVVKKDDLEVIACEKLGIPVYSFPKFLNEFIFKDKKVIVCAGTHGKTTVTAFLSYVLETLGLDPTYLVGGVLKHSGLNFRTGKNYFVVIEGDEYPASFFDRKAKFLYYQPFSLILTNLEYDHADFYPDLLSLKKTFSELINLVPQEGVIVYNYDDKNLRELIDNSSSQAKIISYGKDPKAQFVLLESKTNFNGRSFVNHLIVKTPFKENLELSLSIPGEYNALNALSILALLYGLNLFKEEDIKIFKDFYGVKRRQEIIYADEKLVIVDDFAHHPTAVKKTLIELKKAIKPKKTVVVFEFRTNSSKRKVFQEDYVQSLSLADKVYIKIGPGLENIPKEERIDVNYIIEALRNKGIKADLWKNKLETEIPSSDNKTLVVFMSSAYFNELEEIKNKLIFS